mmetsp:Transcript_2614/g.7867  ORF Transcript_2614/g.7867 Transcript_2614/m.7867 type:complete len:122 (-) Transcript_2614:668-1033(-)
MWPGEDKSLPPLWPGFGNTIIERTLEDLSRQRRAREEARERARAEQRPILEPLTALQQSEYHASPLNYPLGLDMVAPASLTLAERTQDVVHRRSLLGVGLRAFQCGCEYFSNLFFFIIRLL